MTPRQSEDNVSCRFVLRTRTIVKCVPILLTSLAIALCGAAAQAQVLKPATLGNGAGLRNGDYVAIVGDSITEQRIYSVFIEDYLLMCRPAWNLAVTQFGWSGDSAAGFSARMSNDCLPFKPSVATTCYGMNDGGYSPMNEEKGRQYRDSQKSVIRQFKEAGVRFIVLGSPGVVDADTFRQKPEEATMYNKTLAAFRDIDRDLAKEENVAFADVHAAMMDVMTKAKVEYGKKYHVAGGDGVHPDRNGHLVMAYAFLKALGCDGNIGEITVDLAENKAVASEGHRILSCKSGAVEITSRRYPFCFLNATASADAANPSNLRGILKFLPFNQDLNRFLLVVTHAGAERVKVTWGKTSREYAAADLEKGINLAADFLDNPFCESFAAAEAQIAQQQAMEVELVKAGMNWLSRYTQWVPEENAAIASLAAALLRKDEAARAASAAAVKPVTHLLIIQPMRP